jgi:hypothetical protein
VHLPQLVHAEESATSRSDGHAPRRFRAPRPRIMDDAIQQTVGGVKI